MLRSGSLRCRAVGVNGVRKPPGAWDPGLWACDLSPTSSSFKNVNLFMQLSCYKTLMVSEFSPPWRTEMLSETCVVTMKSEEKWLMMLKLGVRKRVPSAPSFFSGGAGWQPCHPCPKATEMGRVHTYTFLPSQGSLQPLLLAPSLSDSGQHDELALYSHPNYSLLALFWGLTWGSAITGSIY